jgi:hypothetical protein
VSKIFPARSTERAFLFKYPVAQCQPQESLCQEENETPEANFFEPLNDLCFLGIIDYHNTTKLQIFRIDNCILPG